MNHQTRRQDVDHDLSFSSGPDHGPFETGLDHHQAGRLSEALVCYRWANDRSPGAPDIAVHLGTTLLEAGRPDEAAGWLRQAIASAPERPDAHLRLGEALQACGSLDEALACTRRAIELGAADSHAATRLDALLAIRGRQEDAIAPLRRAVKDGPELPHTHFDLGFALGKQGRLADAAACYRRVLALRPDDLAALNNLGNVLKALGELDEAADCYRAAIALRPDIASLHSNLGNTLKALGQLDAAVAAYHAALALKPDYREVRLALAMLLMRAGDMVAGWTEYEWRWLTPQGGYGIGNGLAPRWHGEAGDGRTLLIHIDGGFGDTLHFCRYAPLAAARGWRVILEVQPELVRLLRDLPGVAQLVAGGQPPPRFDRRCPMLSLPLALGTTLDTIPAAPGYLHADPTDIAAWGARLSALEQAADQGPRIGIAWAGAFYLDMPDKVMNAKMRALEPDRLASLFTLPGGRFFNLQKGARAPANFALIDFMDEIQDFADTAALICNLDLIITVDTSVAHLAAALGKPVWMMTRHDHCWRWLDGRTDSPWYPTLRIHRQPDPGNWEAVVADVARDLRDYLDRPSPGLAGGMANG